MESNTITWVWDGFLGPLEIKTFLESTPKTFDLPVSSPFGGEIYFFAKKGCYDENILDQAFEKRQSGDLEGISSDGDIVTYKYVFVSSQRYDNATKSMVWTLRYKRRLIRMSEKKP